MTTATVSLDVATAITAADQLTAALDRAAEAAARLNAELDRIEDQSERKLRQWCLEQALNHRDAIRSLPASIQGWDEGVIAFAERCLGFIRGLSKPAPL